MKQIDPDEFMHIHILCLRIIGEWYNERSGGNRQYILRCLHRFAFFFFAFGISLTGQTYHLINNRKKNVVQIADGLHLFITEIITCFEWITFNLNRRLVIELMNDINDIKFNAEYPEHLEIIDKYKRKSWKTCKLELGFSFFGAIATLLAPIFVKFQTLPTNLSYPFFDSLTAPYYHIIYISHFIYKPAILFAFCTYETMVVSFVCFANAQLEIVAFNIKNLHRVVNDLSNEYISFNDEQLIQIALKKCLLRHQTTIKLVKTIEKTFGFILFQQLSMIASITCFSGIKLSVRATLHHPVELLWMLTYVTATITCSYLIFNSGSELIKNSENLLYAAYETHWLNWTNTNRKLLIIFMEQCQIPLSVKIGGIFKLSIVTFKSLMKISYNLFAVLNSSK